MECQNLVRAGMNDKDTVKGIAIASDNSLYMFAVISAQRLQADKLLIVLQNGAVQTGQH